MTTTLGRVMVFTKDTARMRTFYRELLGFDPIEDAPDWVVFAMATGAQLALHQLPPSVTDHITITDPPCARSDSAIKYTFFVDDLPATSAHLTTLGAHMRDPFTYGSRTYCDGLDPEGNVFQIATR